MESEKHIKNLHEGLLRSKYVIFTIVAFLFLLTYLLITVSKEVGTQETQINTAPKASTTSDTSVGYPPNISCNNYKEYIASSYDRLDALRKALGCYNLTPHPTGPYGGSGSNPSCDDVNELAKNINDMGWLLGQMCNRCPMPTAVPGGSGGLFPSPTATPVPSRYYPTPTPTPAPFRIGTPTPTPWWRPSPTPAGPNTGMSQ